MTTKQMIALDCVADSTLEDNMTGKYRLEMHTASGKLFDVLEKNCDSLDSATNWARETTNSYPSDMISFSVLVYHGGIVWTLDRN